MSNKDRICRLERLLLGVVRSMLGHGDSKQNDELRKVEQILAENIKGESVQQGAKK